MEGTAERVRELALGLHEVQPVVEKRHNPKNFGENRREPWDYDRELYKRRNEVERYFLRLKRFRKVFTRYDKLSSIFLSVVMLAMIFDAVFM